MRLVKSHSSIPTYLLLVAACGLAFLCGRWSRSPFTPSAIALLHSEASENPKIVRSPVREIVSQLDKTVSPGPGEWDAIARSSGLYVHHAPLPPGDTGYRDYMVQPFQVLSYFPRILVFPNFVDMERSEAIKRLASSRLVQSAVQLRPGEKGSAQQGVRTSQGTFLTPGQDPSGSLTWLDERIAQVTGIPTSHFEPFNVLRYEMTQHYDSHYDLFNPSEYGKQRSNRIATVIVYLAAPDEGGETIFPLEGKEGETNMEGFDYKTCDRGLVYKPRTGDAVLFWSVRPDGSRDKHALHGGCPVVKGTKWVATKWIRDLPF